MTDRYKSGREGSPLWANLGNGSGLNFQSSQIPTLLVPVNLNAAPQQVDSSVVESGEADHFLGQESPPSTAGVPPSSSSLFSASADSFQIGYGSAPSMQAAPVTSTFQNPTCNFPTSDAGSNFSMPIHSQYPPQQTSLFQPPATSTAPTSITGFSTADSNESSMSYQSSGYSTALSSQSVPMYNPSQPDISMGGQPVAPNINMEYSPVAQHWFYCRNVGSHPTWFPFSYRDSMALEESFLNGEPAVIATDGGRYDVHVDDRIRRSVYWTEDECEVRRCSWFHRDDTNMKCVPYSEELSEELEELYMQTVYNNLWHKRNEVQGSNDIFVFHSPLVFVQFSKGSFPDEFGASYSEMERPKVVKRGVHGNVEGITDGDAAAIDHLVFVVHGIGPVCDLRFRGIVECVDDMRSTSSTILKSHYRTATSNGRVSRVEYLPIYWYDALRCEAVGVDNRLKNITLPSIKKLRQFTNETLLDILFYNSPLYSQSIVERVAGELNRLYNLFLTRNPGWRGQISLAGHSLGALVLFDILSMQGVSQPPPQHPQPVASKEVLQKTVAADVKQLQQRTSTPVMAADMFTERPGSVASSRSTPIDRNMQTIETIESVLEHLGLSGLGKKFDDEQIDFDSLLMLTEDDLKSIGIPLGPRKKILKFVVERQKKAADQIASEPAAPKPLNEAATLPASISELSLQNNDANRNNTWLAENASNTSVIYVGGLQGVGLPLVQYPQLEFKIANFFALGSPVAMFLTIRGLENLSRDFQLPTCPNMFNIFHPYDPVAYRMEPLINPDIKKRPVQMPHHKGRKRLHLELRENIVKVGADIKDRLLRSLKSTWASINDFAKAHKSGASGQPSEEELNQHVDSVLQSAALQDDRHDMSADLESISSIADDEVEVGQLNQGRRIDYVLQEAPLESFNDYLFALSSHTVYWNSEDVALMLMKEIYTPMGVNADQKDKTPAGTPAPQSALASQPNYPSSTASSTSSVPLLPSGPAYPSQPPIKSTASQPVRGPPPTSGFVPTAPPPMRGFFPRP